MECILTPYKETADFLNIKARGTYSHYCALKYLHYGSFFSEVVSWVRHLLPSTWQYLYTPYYSYTLYLFQQLLRATNRHARTHTREGSSRTLCRCLSLSASLVFTAHFYSDHSFFTMLLSGGFQLSPYAAGLQSPLLVFDTPFFHFILLLCVCVRPF